MLALGIIDVRNINPETVGDVSENSLLLRAKEAKKRDEARLKFGAYFLLSHLAEKYMGCENLPEICYTPMGKPYFKDRPDFQFNISHDRNLCAVILTDTYAAVGVDMQSMPDREIRLEKIKERFFSPLDYLSGKERKKAEEAYTLPVKVEFFNVKETECGYSAEKLSRPEGFLLMPDADTAELDFLTRWTLLEANVKATGEGISTYRDTKNLDTHTYITAFKHEKHTFSLSVAAIDYK